MSSSKIISFNKPSVVGSELENIQQALANGNLGGNGPFTKSCQNLIKDRYQFLHCLLTTSGSDALEMTALLSQVGPGDEVLLPSYTFSATANAFLLRGATLRFVDSLPTHPNMDCDQLEEFVSDRTKAVCVVHYAGTPCDMDRVLALKRKYNFFLVEDAAHAIDVRYRGKALGGFGDAGIYSFHETKNVTSGEGGLLIVSDPSLVERSEIIWEKGTNRTQFARGEVNKYEWVDIGSSFVPSELNAAFLLGQLERIDEIQAKRKQIWNAYYAGIADLSRAYGLLVPDVSAEYENNGHIFFMVFSAMERRDQLIRFCRERHVYPVFHYQALHHSPFFRDHHQGPPLPNSLMFSDRLVRLPIYYSLELTDVARIVELVADFLKQHGA